MTKKLWFQIHHFDYLSHNYDLVCCYILCDNQWFVKGQSLFNVAEMVLQNIYYSFEITFILYFQFSI